MKSPMQPDPIDPIDAWNDLVDFAGSADDAAELDRLDALSPEEIEAELAAAGYGDKAAPLSGPRAATSAPDVAAALLAPETAPAHDENVVPFGRRRRGWLLATSPLGYVGYAAAAGAAGLIAARALGLLGPHEPAPSPTPVPRETPAPSAVPETPPVPSPLLVAGRLREDAREACARKDWRVCVTRLDEAKGHDPEGDETPEVGALRAKANAGLEAEDRKGGGR